MAIADNQNIEKIHRVFVDHFKINPEKTERLAPSGSNRNYYRIYAGDDTVIAVFNEDIIENRAFISFTKSFYSLNLPVPKFITSSNDEMIYLLEDLGNITVYELLKQKPDKKFILTLYKRILDKLILFQFEGHKVINYSLCYPRNSFDNQSVRWDLNYFKYNFVKLLNISFNEQLLENDFNKLIDDVDIIPKNTFLYRDCQSSNIMFFKDEIFFIDYQGGRKGPFYYDLASLLYDAKADLEDKIRLELKDYYFNKIKSIINIGIDKFESQFKLLALVRILQAMGAYGYRGLYQRKEQFVKSIPFAITNLKGLVHSSKFTSEFPELNKIFNQLFNLSQFKRNYSKESGKLTVSINSFSYKKGIPPDTYGNGGGFVFDCRGLPNPGRYEEYKLLTGNDKPVIDFFTDKPVVNNFLNDVYKIVDITVEDYLQRKRTHLMINFGCTGGQHRSVYCAENLANHLKHYDLNISLKHLEQENV